jgi:acyl-CoA reductase-like NAD-dependent aldehyde dehydrogenase
MPHWLIIPALTAGNTVILKPSEETPLIAQAYVDIFNQVLPENVLQIIHGTDEQGKALVEADVSLIAFTGSQKAGKDIMKNAAEALKRLVMELGGKDPLIVMKDADIDQAVRFAVANSFNNAGQVCISTERIFVDEGIADEFEQKAAHYAQYYKVGPWNDQKANIGPIINDKQRNNIIRQIEDAIDKGAKVLGGGNKHPERYILPTVLTNVTDDMLIAKEETFGPVVCITRYTDIDEAIKAANNTTFGLGAVVFGSKNSEIVAKQLQAGMVGINQGVGGIGDTPWVGAKQSGFGYHGSPDGHRQFTQVRVISKRSMDR